MVLNMKNQADIKPMTIGSFEYVSLPALKINNTIAKIDTGAYSGAVHCTGIKTIKRKSDGVVVLCFLPFGRDMDVIECENFYVVYVRSSSGHRQKRYLIDAAVIIRNKQYTVKIGLSDRSDMKREILIGRRFLRQNNILVDVRINQDLDSDIGGKI